MNKKKKQNNIKKWLKYFFLGGILVNFFTWLFSKKIKIFSNNFKIFSYKEKKEVDKLFSQKESINEFVEGSGSVFKDYFIPNNSNNHRPKILRSKSLIIVIIVLIVIKVCVLGYLFWLYPNQAKMSEQMASRLLDITNQERIINNLIPFQLNSDLSSAALAKANDMLEHNYFAHHGPDGCKPWEWINRDDYRYLLVGENLAMNFSSAETAHKALMDSESHRKNILNNKYKDIGLAVVTGEFNGKITNILVELFAFEQEPILASTIESPSTPKPIAELKEIEQAELDSMEEDIAVLSLESAIPELEDAISGSEVSEKDVIEESEPIKHQVKLSPNLLLETKPNQEIIHSQIASYSKESWAVKLIKWSKYIYLIVLSFLTIAMLINILVRITIQHRSIIIQSVLTIVLITGMLLLRFHILEDILDVVSII